MRSLPEDLPEAVGGLVCRDWFLPLASNSYHIFPLTHLTQGLLAKVALEMLFAKCQFLKSKGWVWICEQNCKEVSQSPLLLYSMYSLLPYITFSPRQLHACTWKTKTQNTNEVILPSHTKGLYRVPSFTAHFQSWRSGDTASSGLDAAPQSMVPYEWKCKFKPHQHSSYI